MDALLDGSFNSTECNLKVTVQGGVKDRINVFLVIPEDKVFNNGSLLTDTAYWGFCSTDGNMHLPKGAKASVFAVSEGNGKTYFGRTNFVITDSQTIGIVLKESSLEEIKQFLNGTKLNSTDTAVKNTKNFDKIIKLNNEIKRIWQRTTDCSCNKYDTVMTVPMIIIPKAKK